MILALDTSTSAVTVAALGPDGTPHERTVVGERRHGALLAPLVGELLAEVGVRPAELRAVVTGVGPGPYTSLRVGVMTASAFGFAAGVPVHGLCSHDALALQSAARAGQDGRPMLPGEVLGVATDAKRREVFASTYRVASTDTGDGLPVLERLGGPLTLAPADVPAEQAALPTAGRGPALYPDAFGHDLDVPDVGAGWLTILAARALRDGAADVLLEPLPLYLRRPDAAEPPPRVPVGVVPASGPDGTAS